MFTGMHAIAFSLISALTLAGSGSPWGEQPLGALLLGHGGGARWNEAVADVRKMLSSQMPTEVAFGMADAQAIQKGLDRLAARRVRKVVVVPLFISSYSEVMEQTKYVLGLRRDPSPEFTNAPHSHRGHGAVRRIRFDKDLVLTSALDGHPIVSDILLSRAQEMSRDPGKESVILVGHGPLKDEDNLRWLDSMNHLAQEVQRRGGFSSVRAVTMRDDSPPDVRRRADQEIQDMVRDMSRQGRVLVVPHLLAPGGVERHIQRALQGYFYAWTGKTLLPDPGIARWALEMIQKSANEPDTRQYREDRLPGATQGGIWKPKS